VELMMKRTALRVARLAAGVLLLVLGVIGLFLPFLQGILFIVIGLTLLSPESALARRWLDWLRSTVERKQATDPRRKSDGRE
jgi:uncharacterized membrane protein YbaN (DUF454 family)